MEWRITGHSTVGTSHIASGVECQDYNGHFTLPGGVAVIAAADGAGSARDSALGARCAVETALDCFRLSLIRPSSSLISGSPTASASLEALLRDALDTAHRAVAALAQDTPDSALRHFHTTLTLAVLTNEFAATAQVGDGAVVLHRAGDVFEVLTQADNGEFINETSFVTESNYAETVRVAIVPALDALGCAVMTDGMKLLAINFAANTASPGFFGPLFRYAAAADFTAEKLGAFLASERVCQHTDDDKTLVFGIRL